MTDPFPTPTRTEPRGAFPPHTDPADPPGPLTAEQARRAARDRLEAWRRDHE